MSDEEKRSSNSARPQDNEKPSSGDKLKQTKKAASNKNVAPSALVTIASSHPVSQSQQDRAFDLLLKMEKDKAEVENRRKDAETKGVDANAEKTLAEAEEQRAETSRRNKAASTALPSPEHKTRMEWVEFATSVLSAVLVVLGGASVAMSVAAEGNDTSVASVYQWAPHLKVYGTGAAAGGLGLAVLRFKLKHIAARLFPLK
jgi:hypothetical protein